MKAINTIYESLCLFIFLLIIVWPMPHIIVIRNILMFLIFINSLGLFYFNKNNFIKTSYQKQEYLLFILFFLFLFLTFILSYFSSFKSYCIKEFTHQFLFPLILGLSAFFIIKSNTDYKKIFEIIFWGMLLFVIYHVLYSFHFFLMNHKLPLRSYGITVGLDELNFMMPYLFSFFAAEFLSRILNKKPFILHVSNPTLLFLFLISIFSLIVQNKRNGYISLIFLILSISAFIYIFYKRKHNLNFLNKKTLLLIIGASAISLSLAYIDYKLDPRWKDFKKTFNIVFVENNMDWYKYQTPKNTDDSTYRRMFYYKESWKFFKENPMGYGFGRDIFSKIASEKYHIKFHDHAHSGFLNILLGEGIFGFILFSFIMFLFMFIGIKNFFKYKSLFGLLLFYFSTSFYFRNFIDALFKNHYLQQFVFLAFLTFFAMKKEIQNK